MKVKTRVDNRAFRDFYADPAKRHQVHYGFAHRFLPHYVHKNPYGFFAYLFRPDMPGGAIEPTVFIHTRWTMFEETAKLIPIEGDPINGGMVCRQVTELSMSIHVVEDKPVTLVQMPSPEKPGEAYFVAAALLASPADPKSWPPDLGARVFTLESLHVEMYPDLPDAGQRGVFCEWMKNGEHRNFGFKIRAEREAVLDSVARALLAPDAPAMAGYTPTKGIFISGGRGLP
jgi:hypothetical protein